VTLSIFLSHVTTPTSPHLHLDGEEEDRGEDRHGDLIDVKVSTCLAPTLLFFSISGELRRGSGRD